MTKDSPNFFLPVVIAERSLLYGMIDKFTIENKKK